MECVVLYKQKCSRCKNMVVVSGGTRYPLCYDCQKSEMKGAITDPEMKAMFDLPEELYKESSFLRSIKVNYLKFGKLSDKQIAVFKKVSAEMKAKSPQ